ncbi:MAG: hypothetical protein H6660_08775 [Ardenticatenaceae bacterium]|nr:hypothetical protein [Ardenticatenaceae bacterium]
MFFLIPYTRFTLKTYLNAQEAERRLAERTRARRWLRSFLSKPDPSQPFEGVVENGRFNINRIINYRNSFLPIIVGQFHDDLGFTRIEITMRLHYFVMAFMGIWFFAFCPVGFMFFVSDDMGRGEFIILFFGFILFFIFMILATFNYEANKARRTLEEVWETPVSL